MCGTSDGLMCIGGHDGKKCVSACQRYRTTTGRWQQCAPMPTPRQAAAAVLIQDHVYVMGGVVEVDGEWQSTTCTEAYSLSEDVWEKKTPMKQGMIAPISAGVGNTICVLYNDNHKYSVTRTLQLYNAVNDQWRFGASLPDTMGRTFGARAVGLDDSCLVAGGPDNLCARYMIRTNRWEELTPPHHMHHYGSLILHAGEVLIMGGVSDIEEDDDGYGLPSDIVESFDVSQNTWSVCTWRMPQKLWLHHAVLLPVDK